MHDGPKDSYCSLPPLIRLIPVCFIPATGNGQCKQPAGPVGDVVISCPVVIPVIEVCHSVKQELQTQSVQLRGYRLTRNPDYGTAVFYLAITFRVQGKCNKQNECQSLGAETQKDIRVHIADNGIMTSISKNKKNNHNPQAKKLKHLPRLRGNCY